jgi:hypothetical protein
MADRGCPVAYKVRGDAMKQEVSNIDRAGGNATAATVRDGRWPATEDQEGMTMRQQKPATPRKRIGSPTLLTGAGDVTIRAAFSVVAGRADQTKFYLESKAGNVCEGIYYRKAPSCPASGRREKRALGPCPVGE